MGWNGTHLKTSWLRLRGNASGRKPAWWEVPFYCDGCKKMHGKKVERNKTLDGLLLCNRQYYRYLDNKPLNPINVVNP